MSSADYVCCIYPNVLQSTFVMDANSMNPDQTAPKGAVWSGSILFAKGGGGGGVGFWVFLSPIQTLISSLYLVMFSVDKLGKYFGPKSG